MADKHKSGNEAHMGGGRLSVGDRVEYFAASSYHAPAFVGRSAVVERVFPLGLTASVCWTSSADIGRSDTVSVDNLKRVNGDGQSPIDKNTAGT